MVILLIVNELRNLLGTFIMSLEMEPCIVHVAHLFCSVPSVFIIIISIIFKQYHDIEHGVGKPSQYLYIKRI